MMPQVFSRRFYTVLPREERAGERAGERGFSSEIEASSRAVPIDASSPQPFQETQLQHVDNQWLILFRLGRKLLGHQIKSD